VTSPPYDNLRKYNGYVFDFEGIAQELYRVISPGGVIVWVVADATVNGSETGTSFKQALYFKEIGFNLHDTMIYYRWSGPMNCNRYEQEFEYMFILSKGKPKTFNPIIVPCKYYGIDGDRTGQKYRSHDEKNCKLRSNTGRSNVKEKRIKGNVWKLNTSAQKGECCGHPAQFPEQLARDHILSWSNPEDIILDPMCGSGTTLKMALENNRRYIGIEISEEYIKLAEDRIKAVQIKMF